MVSKERAKASDRTLYGLVALAVVMSVGHHIDHVIRGNNVGWPINSEVNAFTYSLAIYPLILTALLLHRAGEVGPGFWALLSEEGRCSFPSSTSCPMPSNRRMRSLIRTTVPSSDGSPWRGWLRSLQFW